MDGEKTSAKDLEKISPNKIAEVEVTNDVKDGKTKERIEVKLRKD